MFSDFPIQFEHPIWLLLLLLIGPSWWIARRSIGAVSRGKAYTSLAFRSLVIAALALAIAEPMWVKRGDGVTVMMIVDVSQSIPIPLQRKSIEFLDRVVAAKEDPDDRVGVITIAKDAVITAMPDPLSRVTGSGYSGNLAATNLASGIQLAFPLFPEDTASRIVIVSDGNETEDSVLAAAEIAQANKIPVDVVPIQYNFDNEIIFDSLKVPARARLGQTVDVRMSIRSQHPATGRLSFYHNGVLLDLDPSSDSSAMRVSLDTGPNIIAIPIALDTGGSHQFRAVFEPDDSSSDAIKLNNEGVGITYAGGEGRVLVIDPDEEGGESIALVKALKAANIETVRILPQGLTGGAAFLNGFDVVILANVGRDDLIPEDDIALHAYVHDLGGGLIMLGGDRSFGTTWRDSFVAKALPVELEPPQTRQMTSGALALVMHSCEMPQGNYWGQRTAILAIEALSRLDFCGIVTYNWNNVGANGTNSNWEFPMQRLGDKSSAIAAAKKMVVGDMPDFSSSLQVALQGLTSGDAARAGQKHVIIISDGDPAPPSGALIQQFINAGITITTVMVAGHGTANDLSNMKMVAQLTNGTFYNVTNPNKLPQIFIKEATLVARSLIVEGEIFQPTVTSRLPGPVDAFPNVPTITGYVLTVPREGLAQTPIVNQTTEGPDPIYAYWNYGLGKSVAFTSDITGRWGAAWTNWNQFAVFWERTVRWAMRPAMPPNLSIKTRTEGDDAIVDIEALDESTGFMNFADTSARVVKPDGSVEMVPIQQVGPGRYRGDFPVEDAGAYLVNVLFSTNNNTPAASVHAAVSVPYPREFRSTRDNKALLTTLADRTGGRVIMPGDPLLADLFNKDTLVVPRSAKQIWDLLAIIAASLFVLDVAVRRIALEPGMVVAGARRALGRRAQTETSTVDAWKRARAQAGTRRHPVSAEARAEAATKFEVTENAPPTIDIAAETSSGPSLNRPSPASAPGSDGSSPSADSQTEDYTSRLLKAKRRAKPSEGEEKPGA